MKHDIVAREPLMDWALWEQYRDTVQHPAGRIQAGDLENARRNLERFEWAAGVVRGAQEQVDPYLDRFTPEFLEQMIPANSGQPCYQCPACRDQGLPRHPGGDWAWSVDDPEVVTCNVCGTVFPNDDYAETIVLECRSEHGKGQTFHYYGGETFTQWGYPHCRPSFSGMVRIKKVGWCTNMAARSALAHALTGELAYAEVVRRILLRLADVYPNYLLVSTYGEIADMDPHVAGLCLTDLPEDELVYPPNKPDRVVYAGYWATGRVGGGGMEGSGFTRAVLQAYEFTCSALGADGTSLYPVEERVRIERDLILESCVHLIGEKKINNKSVGNRVGVGMVGISMGHPGLVRFGLEGWELTMDNWFLSDDTTPESPAYALMSLSGIHLFPQAMRGYADPAGYRDGNGKRIDGLDLYEGKYRKVWGRMFEGLQGNLRYPPYADSYRDSDIGAHFAELLAANYPDRPEYLTLLREHAGENLEDGDPETALFSRKPGIENEAPQPLRFEDNFFPVLCLGQVRSGEDGRRSFALLSATHWGGHHHQDSLNLYYWKDGQELLTDLGYLWDHPKAGMTKRTFSHITGMVDLENQKTEGRGGTFHLFHTGARVKVMEASSTAYDEAEVYRRTVVQVEHGNGDSYLMDIFRLRAPGSRDFVYHGPNGDFEATGIDTIPVTPEEQEALRAGGMDLAHIRSGSGADGWRAVWQMDADTRFSVHNCGQPGEEVYVGDGWGQRDHRNTDIGATIPYFVRRHRPESGLSAFCTVYESHPAASPLVRSVSRCVLPGPENDSAVVLAVETRDGTDLIVSQIEPVGIEVDTPIGRVLSDGRLAVLCASDSGERLSAIAEGDMVRLDDVKLSAEHLTAHPELSEQVSA